jgi:hypothetical protein
MPVGAGFFMILLASAMCLRRAGVALCAFTVRWHPRFAFGFFSVAPVRGGTYFFFAAAKKSRQKKAAFKPPVPARITQRYPAVEPSRSDANTP